MSRFDTPEMVPLIAGLIGALIVALAIFGLIDMDDTKQRQPLPAPAYVTRATVQGDE